MNCKLVYNEIISYKSFEKNPIDFSKYEQCNFGCLSDVYMSKKHVIKKYNIKNAYEDRIDKNLLSNCLREVFMTKEAHSILDTSSNCLDYFLVEDEYNFYIRIERIEGNDLNTITNSSLIKGETISPVFIKKLGLWLFESLNALFKNGIVHGDIKLDNIIYQPVEDKFYLIDFGHSYSISPKYNNRLRFKKDILIGTYIFLSPNYIKCFEEDRINNNVIINKDLWAAGMCVFEMYNFYIPFQEEINNLLELRNFTQVRELISNIKIEHLLMSDDDKSIKNTLLFILQTKTPPIGTIINKFVS